MVYIILLLELWGLVKIDPTQSWYQINIILRYYVTIFEHLFLQFCFIFIIIPFNIGFSLIKGLIYIKILGFVSMLTSLLLIRITLKDTYCIPVFTKFFIIVWFFHSSLLSLSRPKYVCMNSVKYFICNKSKLKNAFNLFLNQILTNNNFQRKYMNHNKCWNAKHQGNGEP